jgi:hypothetical protein
VAYEVTVPNYLSARTAPVGAQAFRTLQTLRVGEHAWIPDSRTDVWGEGEKFFRSGVRSAGELLE